MRRMRNPNSYGIRPCIRPHSVGMSESECRIPYCHPGQISYELSSVVRGKCCPAVGCGCGFMRLPALSCRLQRFPVIAAIVTIVVIDRFVYHKLPQLLSILHHKHSHFLLFPILPVLFCRLCILLPIHLIPITMFTSH